MSVIAVSCPPLGRTQYNLTKTSRSFSLIFKTNQIGGSSIGNKQAIGMILILTKAREENQEEILVDFIRKENVCDIQWIRKGKPGFR